MYIIILHKVNTYKMDCIQIICGKYITILLFKMSLKFQKYCVVSHAKYKIRQLHEGYKYNNINQSKTDDNNNAHV